MAKKKDIELEGKVIPSWDPAEISKSLDEIQSYVIGEAGKASEWYLRAKRPKARLSRAIRLLEWFLAAVGGLLPVVAALFSTYVPESLSKNNGLWASLLIGIAAALFGLDKGFGYSSGWTRYVLTATNIRKALEEFRMDWAELRAEAGDPPTAESAKPLLECAKKFRADIENLVLQETKDWITEFQSSMAQMEKDVAAQLATLKTQVDKTIQARETANQPGLLELTVPNADKADGGKVQVVLEGPAKITGEIQPGSKSFAKENLPSGQYRLVISARVGGADKSAEIPIVIKPGEVNKPQLGLPV